MHDEEMASTPSEFWQQREELVPSMDTAEEVDDYRLVLLADIDDPDVLSWYEGILDALDRFACLDTVSPETLHFTVKLFDVAVSPSTTAVDDQPSTLGHVTEIAAEAATRVDPFKAEVTQFNLFPDVVYGEVADDGQFAALNQTICDHTQVRTLDRDGTEFIPHLTFGYFTGDEDYDALIEFIETNRELQCPAMPIDEIHLVAYEVGGRPPTYNRINTYEL